MELESNKKLPYLSDKTLEALEFAAIAHQDQRRKGADKVPYISHPAMVGTILARGGFGEDIVVAGILHDVIEDTSFGYEDISKKFGVEIAKLVLHVSENKSLPYLERKQKYLDNLKTAPMEALAVSMADSMANLMSISIYENIYHNEVETEYKNTVNNLIKNGSAKLEIISKRMQHPLIAQWQELLDRASSVAQTYNA